MQLSLHADYSCRVLMYLAICPQDTKIAIDEIAEAYGISANHLVKVVHSLGKLGFIETSRGRGGGITLARSPEDIQMGDVIRQMEPGFDLVECFNSERNTCPIIGACGLKPWLGKAMAAFLSTLDGLSLADVTRRRAQLTRSLRRESGL